MNLKTIFLILIGVWLVLLFFLWLYIPLTQPITHTYGYPSAACVNQLTSDRGSFEAVRVSIWLAFYSFVPWSIVVMIWSKEKAGWTFHLVYIVLMVCYGILMFAADIVYMTSANVGPDSPYFKTTNFARDPKWCNLFAGQPGTSTICCNTGPCLGPGVLIENLQIAWPYVVRFSANVFLTLLMCVDFWFLLQWRYAPKKRQ